MDDGELPVKENGYALDLLGNCGKSCKICKMWNEKMKKDSVATVKEVQLLENSNKYIDKSKNIQ